MVSVPCFFSLGDPSISGHKELCLSFLWLQSNLFCFCLLFSFFQLWNNFIGSLKAHKVRHHPPPGAGTLSHKQCGTNFSAHFSALATSPLKMPQWPAVAVVTESRLLNMTPGAHWSGCLWPLAMVPSLLLYWASCGPSMQSCPAVTLILPSSLRDTFLPCSWTPSSAPPALKFASTTSIMLAITYVRSI